MDDILGPDGPLPLEVEESDVPLGLDDAEDLAGLFGDDAVDGEE